LKGNEEVVVHKGERVLELLAHLHDLMVNQGKHQSTLRTNNIQDVLLEDEYVKGLYLKVVELQVKMAQMSKGTLVVVDEYSNHNVDVHMKASSSDQVCVESKDQNFDRKKVKEVNEVDAFCFY